MQPLWHQTPNILGRRLVNLMVKQTPFVGSMSNNRKSFFFTAAIMVNGNPAEIPANSLKRQLHAQIDRHPYLLLQQLPKNSYYISSPTKVS